MVENMWLKKWLKTLVWLILYYLSRPLAYFGYVFYYVYDMFSDEYFDEVPSLSEYDIDTIIANTKNENYKVELTLDKYVDEEENKEYYAIWLTFRDRRVDTIDRTYAIVFGKWRENEDE